MKEENIEPIRLNDILRFSEEELKNTRIRLNMENKNSESWNPIELFKNGQLTQLINGHYWKNNSYKTRMTTIAFAKIEKDLWLLFHIGTVTKELDVKDAVGYEYQEVENYKPYFGRLIMKFKHSFQQNIVKAENFINDMYVYKILPQKFSDDSFPGYENVNVSWKELVRLIKNSSWKTALSNQKGVYLITDSKTGKMYVGSATGEKMILQRWNDYLDNGHGGDKKLKELVKSKSIDYIRDNFNYSILQIFNSNTDDDFILERESWWKKILLTREFGYNGN